jgi:fructuronate reductase
MDGSQKLPQRLLGIVSDNLDAGRNIAGLALAVAGWMRYVGGVDEKGAPIDVKDPHSAQLRAVYDSAESPKDKVAALLEVREIFPTDLAANTRFRTAVTTSFTQLYDIGARATVQGMT